MLTVRNKDSDIIQALNGGADDYVIEPFSPGQVMARCQALKIVWPTAYVKTASPPMI